MISLLILAIAGKHVATGIGHLLFVNIIEIWYDRMNITELRRGTNG